MVLDTSCFEQLPFWNDLSPSEKALVHDKAKILRYKKSRVVRRSDRPCPGLIHILEGVARVYIISPEGREITLFYLNRGDCCVFSAACVLEHILFETCVVTASEARLLNIGPKTYSLLEESNINVRCFSYELATMRFSTALWVMQEIVFTRFDKRLARFLLDIYRECGSPEINIKQEDLACQVNAARESVARMLRHFVNDGLIVSKRGCIVLTDLEALQEIAT